MRPGLLVPRRAAPLLVGVAWLVGGACAEAAAPGGEPERLVVEVRRTLAHDPASFTQGLVMAGGELYESRGQYGESSLRRLDRRTGELLDELALEAVMPRRHRRVRREDVAAPGRLAGSCRPTGR